MSEVNKVHLSLIIMKLASSLSFLYYSILIMLLRGTTYVYHINI